MKVFRKLATPLFLIACLCLGFLLARLVQHWRHGGTPSSQPDILLAKRGAPPPATRGITLDSDKGASPEDASAAFKAFDVMGVNCVALAPEIHSLADIQSTDAALRASTQAAARLHFRVCYLPRISFRGLSLPTRHELLQAVARHARDRGYDMLALGYQAGEADPQETFWRPSLAAARREFPGQLLYVASINLYPYVDWWDTVDFVSVAGPFTISYQRQPTSEQLRLGYQAQLDTIGSIGQREGKQVLLFDVAHPASDLAATEPASRTVQKPRPDLQQACMQAAVETIRGEPWLHGVFLATWHLDPAAAKLDPAALNDAPRLLQIIADQWSGTTPATTHPAELPPTDTLK